MRTMTDKIGYSLVIIGFFAMIFKYGNYILYETIYLINGNVVYTEIVSKEIINEKYIYHFIIQGENAINYLSLPTYKEYNLEEIVKVRTVPLFEKVFLGEFVLVSYLLGILLLVFGFVISTLSFWMITGIENKFTLRIKSSKR